ncbi:MAG: type II secretion system F family protein [Eggerthellaceae bacterium]|nr:type II secretion system F family protein [Eggerthellaceae bacterium]
MGAEGVWLALAALLALAAGGLVGTWAWQAAQRRRLTASALLPEGSRGARLLARRGVAPLIPLAKRLMRIDAVAEAVDVAVAMQEERGRQAQGEALLSLVLAAIAATAAAAGVASGSAVCAVAVGCCAAAGGVASARTARDKRSMGMREEVPEALRCMGVCFRSGLSLLQTLQQTAREVEGPLAGLFETAARRLEMGGTSSEALAALHGERRVPELAFVAVALDVQHASGGSIAPVLDAARESVEGELELLRALRVQTAQAKLSARIVTLMPFVLVALFSLMSSDFLAPFFESATGVALLGMALAMQLAGVLVVRRMLKVEAG